MSPDVEAGVFSLQQKLCFLEFRGEFLGQFNGYFGRLYSQSIVEAFFRVELCQGSLPNITELITSFTSMPASVGNKIVTVASMQI